MVRFVSVIPFDTYDAKHDVWLRRTVGVDTKGRAWERIDRDEDLGAWVPMAQPAEPRSSQATQR